MLTANRVLWGEGMFLRPQHFQQQGLYHENSVAEVMQLLRRNAWGVRTIALDAAALTTGLVRVDRLSVLFRDGTRYSAPEKEPLPVSRNLNDIPQAGTSTTLFACLPDLNPYGANSSRPDEQASRPARFSAAQASAPDLYTQALETDVSTLHLNVRLMTTEENRDGHDSIAIARLHKDATGQWRADEGFLGPMVCCGSSPTVNRQIRRLLDILRVKADALSGSHRERASKVSEFGTTDIGSFWLLHTINRNFARLNHLFGAVPLHPEELYLALAEFCGELITFSSLYKLDDIPPYRHADLTATLSRLDEQLRELLDTVISARHVVIPLTSPKPSFHIGRLESDRLIENVDFYLSVKSDMPAAQLIDSVPLKLKIGAPDDVDRILNSALRGVSLAHAAQTPSALPIRAGNHYFALEANGDIYQRMIQARSISIYVPQTLSGITLELVAVFR